MQNKTTKNMEIIDAKVFLKTFLEEQSKNFFDADDALLCLIEDAIELLYIEYDIPIDENMKKEQYVDAVEITKSIFKNTKTFKSKIKNMTPKELKFLEKNSKIFKGNFEYTLEDCRKLMRDITSYDFYLPLSKEQFKDLEEIYKERCFEEETLEKAYLESRTNIKVPKASVKDKLKDIFSKQKDEIALEN